MTIQEILKEANYPTESDNRNRATRQLNTLFAETEIKVIVIKKGYIATSKTGYKYNISVSGWGKQSLFYTNQSWLEPIDILVRVGKFFKREEIKAIIKAEIKLPCTCGKCNGSGILPQFMYYADGVCFDCAGSGYTSFATSVKIQKSIPAIDRIIPFRLRRDTGWEGLTELYAISNFDHPTAKWAIFENEDFYFVGQKQCQDGPDFKIPKSDFAEFVKNFNKTNYKKVAGEIKTPA